VYSISELEDRMEADELFLCVFPRASYTGWFGALTCTAYRAYILTGETKSVVLDNNRLRFDFDRNSWCVVSAVVIAVGILNDFHEKLSMACVRIGWCTTYRLFLLF
jgi:hypothetical protein